MTEEEARADIAKAAMKAIKAFIISLHQDGHSNSDIYTWANLFKSGISVSEGFVAATIKNEENNEN